MPLPEPHRGDEAIQTALRRCPDGRRCETSCDPGCCVREDQGRLSIDQPTLEHRMNRIEDAVVWIARVTRGMDPNAGPAMTYAGAMMQILRLADEIEGAPEDGTAEGCLVDA